MYNRKIHFSGSVYEGSGYASALRGYLKAMKENNYDVTFNNINYSLEDNYAYNKKEYLEYFKSMQVENYRALDKDKIFINHSTPDILFSSKYFKVNCGYSVWETDLLAPFIENKINELDFIITSSEYSKAAFLNSGVEKPVYVIPHIVEPFNFSDKPNEQLEKLVKDKIVFLSIFDWHIGKGYDLLIKGFVEAFKNNPNVLLILKTNSPVVSDLSSVVKSKIKELVGENTLPKIYIIAKPITRDSLIDLYKYCDVYVQCSRREAFSMTCAEAMVNKRLVMAPFHGGQRYFLNEDNSILISSEMKAVSDVERNRSNYRGNWVEPSLEDLIEKFKLVYNNWSDYNKEEIDFNAVIEKLSSKVILNQFDSIFEKEVR
jgi:hypothetical protein